MTEPAPSVQDSVPHDFVPPDFVVPAVPQSRAFRLEPLGPEHNERDYAAWTSSFAHIQSTPGFASRGWPHEMTLEANLGDLVAHADDFEARRGFTYSVLDGDEVIGCVYIYPPRSDAEKASGHAVHVSSWVTEERAALDTVLWELVTTWLRNAWPFETWLYAPRMP